LIEQQKRLGTPQRVLVIEDEPSVREAITLYFEISYPGVVVSQHDRSAGVLDDVVGSEPDLVTLDLGLPDGDGPTLIRSIRDVSEVPIIVISAHHDDTSILAATKLGAAYFLVKPIGLIVLQAHVEALMRMKNQEANVSSSDRQIGLPLSELSVGAE
jgi:two-component system KDP operon response regulator KdpE